jgi:hypothetical protein
MRLSPTARRRSRATIAPNVVTPPRRRGSSASRSTRSRP